jgi:hypothetical protein
MTPLDDPELVVIDMSDQQVWEKANVLLLKYEQEAAALTGKARSERRHSFLVQLVATLADPAQ